MLYCFGILVGSSNAKISECLCINLSTLYRIWKELDESNGEYEVMAARKPNFNRSKKWTPKIVDEIQVIIDNESFISIFRKCLRL